jgi:7,8-dihydropterin-6-yl-methyl-4-(beta-D-ribofuranosyl)aminobenzene 5'-phosphate synthase
LVLGPATPVQENFEDLNVFENQVANRLLRPAGVKMRNLFVVLVLMACGSLAVHAQESANRITVLVDAFSDRPELKKDWGYAALVEYAGQRILFDTGNDSELFRYNVEQMGIDLTRLDAVVISHRHGDHTDGLKYLLSINPAVIIYVANDEYFGGDTPPGFFEKSVDTLPPRMRYFDGSVPGSLPHGSPWKHANLHRVSDALEILPGIRVVRNLSTGERFTETPELSLVIDTPTGQVLLVGCSHPGIEQILQSVSGAGSIRLVMGGLHWLTLSDSEVERLASALVNQWDVQSIAPGHCTGEMGFSVLSQLFGDRYIYAGLGNTIDL